MIEGYVTVNELAKRWNMAPRTIQTMCANGKISGAYKFGSVWAVPSEVERPIDHRITTGKYKNWRDRMAKDVEHPQKRGVKR